MGHGPHNRDDRRAKQEAFSIKVNQTRSLEGTLERCVSASCMMPVDPEADTPGTYDHMSLLPPAQLTSSPYPAVRLYLKSNIRAA